MSLNYQCSPQQRKQEIASLLDELHLDSEYIDDNNIKILGKYAIFAEFLPTGHVTLFKYNHKWKRNTHKWTCEGMQAITSYLKQHAL